MTTGLYIGLMSGTSVDGVDAALLSIEPNGFEILNTFTVQYEAVLQQRLLELKLNPTTSLENFIELDHQVASTFAKAANGVIGCSTVTRDDITAIGSHGQTIFHLPNSAYPGTIQLGDPSLIARLTDIDVIADFRRADMAVGGQGAPLAPAFHRFALDCTGDVVLNLGGIANITILKSETIGFDTGPANSILDDWTKRTLNQEYDDKGAWARTGSVDEALLQAMLSDPYFEQQPPKSTGTDYFNLDWALRLCNAELIKPEDLQRTLLELTAITVTDSIHRYNQSATVFVCGGGLKNDFLIDRIQSLLPQAIIQSLDEAGVSAEACECCTFAWLAHQHIIGQPGNLPGVTGARKPAVLGARYRAG